MVVLNIPVPVELLPEVTPAIEGAIRTALQRAALRIPTAVNRPDVVPFKTGALQQSLSVDVEDMGLRLRWSTPYAQAIDQGHAPFTITAKGDKPLTFFWEKKGEWRKMWSVQHPGFRPSLFRLKANQIVTAILGDEIQRAMSSALTWQSMWRAK